VHGLRRYTRAMVRPQSSSPAPARSGAAWTLRSARSVDAEAWHALQRVIYREGVAFVGDGAPSVGALAAKLRSRAPDDTRVAFAVDGGGEIVGWIEVHRMAPRRLAHVAWLTLAVAPSWRRRGLGGALLTDAHAWCQERGLRKVQLHVRAGNAAAIALYRRLGYETEGVLRDQVAVGGGGGAALAIADGAAHGAAHGAAVGAAAYEDEWIMALRLPGRP
jgi:ribosomal protein S18 acetylase RimI-like enzyme